jgi:hypothetical protein
MELKFTIVDKSAALRARIDEKLVGRAKKVKDKRVRKMKTNAPVKTGAYRRGLSGEVSNNSAELSIELGGEDWKSPLIEWDGKKRKGKHIVERGLAGIEQEFAEGAAADVESIGDLC